MPKLLLTFSTRNTDVSSAVLSLFMHASVAYSKVYELNVHYFTKLVQFLQMIPETEMNMIGAEILD